MGKAEESPGKGELLYRLKAGEIKRHGGPGGILCRVNVRILHSPRLACSIVASFRLC